MIVQDLASPNQVIAWRTKRPHIAQRLPTARRQPDDLQPDIIQCNNGRLLEETANLDLRVTVFKCPAFLEIDSLKVEGLNSRSPPAAAICLIGEVAAHMSRCLINSDFFFFFGLLKFDVHQSAWHVFFVGSRRKLAVGRPRGRAMKKRGTEIVFAEGFR